MQDIQDSSFLYQRNLRERESYQLSIQAPISKCYPKRNANLLDSHGYLQIRSMDFVGIHILAQLRKSSLL